MATYTLSSSLDSTLTSIAASKHSPAKNRGEALTRAVLLYDYVRSQLEENPTLRLALINQQNEPVICIDPLP